MSVYYYEGLPIVAPLSITSNEPIFNVTTVALTEQRASQGVQRWELEFGVTTAGDEEDLLVGSVTKMTETSTMVMPQLLSVDRKVTSTVAPVVETSAIVGAGSVILACTEVGKVIPKGSFVQFNTGTKIYILTSTVVTGANVTANIYPTLTAALPKGAKMFHAGSHEKPMLNYRLSLDNMSGITYTDGVLVQVDKINIFEDL